VHCDAVWSQNPSNFRQIFVRVLRVLEHARAYDHVEPVVIEGNSIGRAVDLPEAPIIGRHIKRDIAPICIVAEISQARDEVA
jgi:hypothetical protein